LIRLDDSPETLPAHPESAVPLPRLVETRAQPFGMAERWSDLPAYRVFGKNNEIRRILLIKADHIGDLILGLDALIEYRKAFPEAHLTLACGPWNVTLAQSLGLFDSVHAVEMFAARADGIKPVFSKALLNDLDAQSFDLAVDLRVDSDTRIILSHVNARYKCGFDAGPLQNAQMTFWLPHSIPPGTDSNLGMHQTLLMLRLAHAVRDLFHTTPEVGQLLREKAASPCDFDMNFAVGRILVTCSTASGREAKNWPFERFRNTIDWLCNQMDASVLLLGGPDQRADAERILTHCNVPHLASAVGITNMAQSIDLLCKSDIYLGNDTGLTHIAARIGVPTISIHSGIDPTAMWAAVGQDVTILRAPTACSPCHIMHLSQCFHDHACILDINEDDVRAALRRKIMSASRLRMLRDLSGKLADPTAV
jgi:heptosyltransferase-2